LTGSIGEGGMARLAPEVADALAWGRPVVALESTVLAHGLPRPRNLEVGLALEECVRAGGAVPATIAVIDGTPRIGLTTDELERIATAEDVMKLSTREIPVAIARSATGATTVAATSFLAARAGIGVFATGGIGGVHRGTPPDVSPDIPELGRTRIIVVCAGAKAILDLPATRETLETAGVLVLGWRTDSFPGFYSRDSGLFVDARVDEPGDVASIWRAKEASGTSGGILLCAPVPESAAIPEAELSATIDAAIRRASEMGVRGKDVTPYLLNELARTTAGATLDANIALLHNNVEVATIVAREIAG
jgi:pseudouridine-5'-phosphate glycosidase